MKYLIHWIMAYVCMHSLTSDLSVTHICLLVAVWEWGRWLPSNSRLVEDAAATSAACSHLSVAMALPPRADVPTEFIPLPPRYRLRDLLLGEFAFNDDGER